MGLMAGAGGAPAISFARFLWHADPSGRFLVHSFCGDGSGGGADGEPF